MKSTQSGGSIKSDGNLDRTKLQCEFKTLSGNIENSAALCLPSVSDTNFSALDYAAEKVNTYIMAQSFTRMNIDIFAS